MATKHGHTVRGYVVDDKRSGLRYAVSPRNYNSKVHTKVRELGPGETVLAFPVKTRVTIELDEQAPDPTDVPSDPAEGTKDPSTEGTEEPTN